MDLVSAATRGAEGLQSMGDAQISLLRKSLDGEQEEASLLLQVLPQSASLEPGKGSKLDLYA